MATQDRTGADAPIQAAAHSGYRSELTAVAEIFVARARAIPGVLEAVQTGPAHVRVVLRDRRSTPGRQVRALEGAIAAEFPDSDLDVWLSESLPPGE